MNLLHLCTATDSILASHEAPYLSLCLLSWSVIGHFKISLLVFHTHFMDVQEATHLFASCLCFLYALPALFFPREMLSTGATLPPLTLCLHLFTWLIKEYKIVFYGLSDRYSLKICQAESVRQQLRASTELKLCALYFMFSESL